MGLGLYSVDQQVCALCSLVGKHLYFPWNGYSQDLCKISWGVLMHYLLGCVHLYKANTPTLLHGTKVHAMYLYLVKIWDIGIAIGNCSSRHCGHLKYQFRSQMMFMRNWSIHLEEFRMLTTRLKVFKLKMYTINSIYHFLHCYRKHQQGTLRCCYPSISSQMTSCPQR